MTNHIAFKCIFFSGITMHWYQIVRICKCMYVEYNIIYIICKILDMGLYVELFGSVHVVCKSVFRAF